MGRVSLAQKECSQQTDNMSKSPQSRNELGLFEELREGPNV